MWAEEGKAPIQPKSLGKGIMVSDFVTEHDGLLKLSDSELEIAQHDDITINQEARTILNYGAANEGYWTLKNSLPKYKVQWLLLSLNIQKIQTHLFGFLTRVVAIVHTKMMHLT